MGIAFTAIEKMVELGLLPERGSRVLDIGSSNLYSATPESIRSFLARYGQADNVDAEDFCSRLAAGSTYDPVSGGRNEAFVGELFERVGIDYVSFDIADGFRTTILDLNHAPLPVKWHKAFNLVLNFGTTEHILNQYNCFKVIHDATRTGGFIHHSLPAIGYVDHGYLTYTGRCFFDLAGYNEYELVACWFDGPGAQSSILSSLESYKSYFPTLQTALSELAETEAGRALQALRIPDVGINVVYRKVKDKPFWGALEASTSVGDIPSNVTAVYESGASSAAVTSPAVPSYPATGGVRAALRPLANSLRRFPLLHRMARDLYHVLVNRPRR